MTSVKLLVLLGCIYHVAMEVFLASYFYHNMLHGNLHNMLVCYCFLGN